MWLLDKATALNLENAVKAGRMPTAQEQADYQAEYDNYAAELPRGMSVAGDRASIDIRGVLTDAPDLFARFFGGGNTVYSDIRAGLAAADADPSITQIELSIASGGGQASAEWMATMEAVYNTRKPVRATVRSTAASAAYGIASQADTLQAVNQMAAVGSIGVVGSFFTSDRIVEVTSTNAPNKRPDVRTEEGQATVRAFLDQIESEFIGAVARGRKVDREKVKSDFGQGAMFLASEAESRGMIDGIAASSPSNTATATGGSETNPGAITMDLEKLKAEHPAVYAQAVNEGKAQGATEERDRVEAHLSMAEAAGDPSLAIDAIKSGDGLTTKHIGAYQAATLKAMREQNLAADDTSAADTVKNNGKKAPEATEGDLETQIHSKVLAEMGLDQEG